MLYVVKSIGIYEISKLLCLIISLLNVIFKDDFVGKIKDKDM